MISSKKEAFEILEKWRTFSFDTDDAGKKVELTGDEISLLQFEAGLVVGPMQLRENRIHSIKQKLQLKVDLTPWLSAGLLVLMADMESPVRSAGLLRVQSYNSLINEAMTLFKVGIDSQGKGFFSHNHWLVFQVRKALVSDLVSLGESLCIGLLSSQAGGVVTLLGEHIACLGDVSFSDKAKGKLISILNNSKPLQGLSKDMLHLLKYDSTVSAYSVKRGIQKALENIFDSTGYEHLRPHQADLLTIGCQDLYRKMVYEEELKSLGSSSEAHRKILTGIFAG